jgi:hypothetical protein
MTKFGLLLVRVMVVLVTVIFMVNLVLHRLIVESVLFSLALAGGITPQLLPAIVSICPSAGIQALRTRCHVSLSQRDFCSSARRPHPLSRYRLVTGSVALWQPACCTGAHRPCIAERTGPRG